MSFLTQFATVIRVHSGSNFGSNTGQSGSAATIAISAASKTINGLVTVTGLSGMTTSSVGRYITFTGATKSVNNGTFLITEYVSASSVKIMNCFATTSGETNNGSLAWTEKNQYTISSSAQNVIVEADGYATNIIINLPSTGITGQKILINKVDGYNRLFLSRGSGTYAVEMDKSGTYLTTAQFVFDGTNYYVIYGGINDSQKMLNANGFTTGYESTCFIYNHKEKAFIARADSANAKATAMSAAHDDKLYVIGGENSSPVFTRTYNEMYTDLTNVWTSKATITTDREAAGCHAIEGIIYVTAGGRYNSGTFSNTNVTEKYTISSNTWAGSLTAYPFTAAGIHSFRLLSTNKIHFASGYNSGAAANSVNNYQYDTAGSGTFTAKTAITTARRYGTACSFYSTGLVICGFTTTYTNSVQEYYADGDAWATRTNYTDSLYLSSATSFYNMAINSCGYNGSANVSAVRVYDKLLNAWYSTTSMTSTNRGLTSTSI